MLVYFYPVFFYIALILLALTLIALHLKGHSLYHIIFSAIFGCYLIGTISVAVFPFVIHEPGADFRLSINLVPFNFSNCFDYLPQNCAKDIFNNFLLTVPFGFGIHFVTRMKPKNMPWIVLLIGCSFEIAQLIMAVAFHVGFRAIDINDVIFNTLGAFIGYLLFKLFAWLYLSVIQKYQLKPKNIFAYIHQIITLYLS